MGLSDITMQQGEEFFDPRLKFLLSQVMQGNRLYNGTYL